MAPVLQKNITVTAWNDNNIVVVAHPRFPHPSEMITCDRQVGRQKLALLQPQPINRYNQHMNGVDVHDQLRKKYPASNLAQVMRRCFIMQTASFHRDIQSRGLIFIK